MHAAAAGPEGVTPLLEAWRASTAANISAPPAPAEPRQIPGATPNPSAGLTRLQGRRGDGRPVQATAVFFVGGLTVYQAAVIGETAPPADVVETFVAGLHLDRPARPSR